jgi:hypothetical protein
MDVEIEQPHLAHEHLMHQHPTRHWTDYAIPVSALFVSLISIFIAWQHGEVMQQLVQQNARLVAANSLPYMQLYTSDVGPNGEKRLSLITSNQGVGPAEIRTAEMFVDGKPYPNADSVLSACCGPHTAGSVGISSLAGRMVRPGEVAPYITLANPADAELIKSVKQALADKRIETRLCYCSVFKECWIAKSGRLHDPEPVPQCPPVKAMYQ